MPTLAQEHFRTRQGMDSRHFTTWYDNTDTQRIVWVLYQDMLKNDTIPHDVKQNYLPPHVFFDGLDAISFDQMMSICKQWLLTSGKRYFTFIFKPEMGSAHYMCGILRKETSEQVSFFLFNPTGYDTQHAQKRLNLANTTQTGGMPLILSPHPIQSSQKDGGVLVSCGPISLELIAHALYNSDWIDNLDAAFTLPNHLTQYEHDSQEIYQARITEVRRKHDKMLAKISNDLLHEEIDEFYSYANQYVINHIEELSVSSDGEESEYHYEYDDFYDADEDEEENTASTHESITSNHENIAFEHPQESQIFQYSPELSQQTLTTSATNPARKILPSDTTDNQEDIEDNRQEAKQSNSQAVSEETNEAITSSISLLQRAIQNMFDYGLSLEKKGIPKGKIIKALANDLLEQTTPLSPFHDQEAATFDKQHFLKTLHSKDAEMAAYRFQWDTVIKNILIALTGIGVLLIAAQLVYSYTTQGRPLFFFQQAKTSSEQYIDAIEKHTLT